MKHLKTFKQINENREYPNGKGLFLSISDVILSDYEKDVLTDIYEDISSLNLTMHLSDNYIIPEEYRVGYYKETSCMMSSSLVNRVIDENKDWNEDFTVETAIRTKELGKHIFVIIIEANPYEERKDYPENTIEGNKKDVDRSIKELQALFHDSPTFKNMNVERNRSGLRIKITLDIVK